MLFRSCIRSLVHLLWEVDSELLKNLAVDLQRSRGKLGRVLGLGSRGQTMVSDLWMKARGRQCPT